MSDSKFDINRNLYEQFRTHQKFTNFFVLIEGITSIAAIIISIYVYLNPNENIEEINTYVPRYQETRNGCFQFLMENNEWGNEICIFDWINISARLENNVLCVYSPSDLVYYCSENLKGEDGLDGSTGPVGAQGLQGQKGDKGDIGNCSHITCQNRGELNDCCGSECMDCPVDWDCINQRCQKNITCYANEIINGHCYKLFPGEFTRSGCLSYCQLNNVYNITMEMVLIDSRSKSLELNQLGTNFEYWNNLNYNQTTSTWQHNYMDIGYNEFYGIKPEQSNYASIRSCSSCSGNLNWYYKTISDVTNCVCEVSI